MSKSILLALGLATSVIAGPSAQAGDTIDAKSILAAQSALAVDLLDHTLTKETGTNILISPATLAAALGLAGLGASDEGKVAIAKSLGFAGAIKGPQAVLDEMVPEKPVADGAPLTTAVAIVFDDKLALVPDATATLAAHRVKATVQDLKAAKSVEAINGWVTDATKGAIPTILDAPPGGGFVSLGALSFKEKWKTAFEPDSQPTPFHRPDGSMVSVPMMHLGGVEQKFRVDDRFAAVDLAYAGEGYRMVVIAARSEKGVAPADLKSLAPWLQGEKFETATGEVLLPRFALNDGRDLMPALDTMGLAPTHMQASAFPGFTKDSISLARILQKTMIKVDENGTEAAAATAAVTERSIDPSLIRVVADARFLFALRDTRSGLLLAVGLIGDPLLSSN